MKTFYKSLLTSIISLALLTFLLGIVYPVFMWGIGELFFHKKTNGNLFYYANGSVLGAELIAQNFTSDNYFHPRPSSAGSGYDASNSSGSNLGPTSQSLIDTIKQRAADYRSQNHWDGAIPADAITGSGSGLDPHISVENAQIQGARVASARGLSPEEMDALITKYTEGRGLWLFGEKRVNVLRINLALDRP
jgi:K+-transporting ATPase ATPase C chain